MGASDWEYFVKYQPDIEMAFRELQQATFDSGDYYLVKLDLPATVEEYVEQYSSMYPDGEEEWLRESYRELKERYSKPEPTTIDELIQWNAESGTHSIIDISYFSDDPTSNAMFTVIPLSDEQLLNLFGTTKPTRETILENAQTIRNLQRRSQGTYIVVYENDEPSEIYFGGYSGD